MAKIIAEFDTVEKTLSVSMDGEPMADVVGGSFYRGYDDEFSCSVQMGTEDKTSKIRKFTTIYASESKEAKTDEQLVESKTFAGFKEKIKVENDFAHDVSNFFGK